MGAAYERTGLMRDLKLRRMVSLSWPQDVPVRAFKTWRRPEALAAMSEMWGLKVRSGSKVTPRILGLLSVGVVLPPIATAGTAFTWLVQAGKSVGDDLLGAMFILLFSAQSETGPKEHERRVEMVDERAAIVKVGHFDGRYLEK